jgi:hypothetical protein
MAGFPLLVTQGRTISCWQHQLAIHQMNKSHDRDSEECGSPFSFCSWSTPKPLKTRSPRQAHRDHDGEPTLASISQDG